MLMCQIRCESRDGGLDPSQCPQGLTCTPGPLGSNFPKCEPWAEPTGPLLFKGPDGWRPADGGSR